MNVGFSGISRLTTEQRSRLRATPSSFSPKDGSCIGCGGILALRLASTAINFEAANAKWNTPGGRELQGGLGVQLTEHTGCMQVVTTTQDTSAWMNNTNSDFRQAIVEAYFQTFRNGAQIWQALVRDGYIELESQSYGIITKKFSDIKPGAFTLSVDLSRAELEAIYEILKYPPRSMLHDSFSDGTSNLIGLHAAYLSRVKAGTIAEPFFFWSFAGDGGATIGMGQISSFLQVGRGLLIVYDNRLYANTAGQQSATSMLFSNVATAPVGEAIKGSQNVPRDLIKIAAAHEVPFAATASIAQPDDLMDKVRFAINVNGPTLIWVDAPCPKEQNFPEDQSRLQAELAIETGYWPMVRYQDGKWAMDYLRSQERTGRAVPLEAFVSGQARTSHLAEKGFIEELAVLSAEVERRYAWFLQQAKMSGEAPSLYAPDGTEIPARRLEAF